jgi:photosystem II stability/assembly factor-like uncharacterized protein
MKKTLLIILCLFNLTSFAQQWHSLTTSVSTQLRSVKFLNDNIGWAVGEASTIVKTTDGGTTWTTQASGGSNTYYDVWPVNKDTVWVVGASGTILHSKDGGATWTPQTSASGRTQLGIHCLNDSTCITTTSGAYVEKTTNGGKKWTVVLTTNLSNLYSPVFLNSSMGWIAGSSGSVYKTVDAGSTWTKLTVTGTTALYGVSFVHPDTGFVSEAVDKIHKTVDGGLSWNLQTVGTSPTYVRYFNYQKSTGKLWLVGASGIFKSSDRGLTFAPETSPLPYQSGRLIDWPSAQIGYAAGSLPGTVLKYGVPVGINKMEMETVQLYPNPSDQILNIKLPDSEKINTAIRIYDISWRLMKEITPGKSDQSSNVITIDTSDLTSGIYFIKSVSINGSKTFKAIITH